MAGFLIAARWGLRAVARGAEGSDAVGQQCALARLTAAHDRLGRPRVVQAAGTRYKDGMDLLSLTSCFPALSLSMAEDLRARSAAEVFGDHLRLAGEKRFDEDVERNVSPACMVLERRGVFRGHNGVRELARLLAEELPDARYTYTNRLVEGRIAFLEWTAESEHARVRDGADSFLIEDGWIIAQTIHYTVEAK
jgi:hypothetical protein